MTTLTVWNNPTTNAVMLVQLSEDPADGTAEEQIAYLSTLWPYKGFECVAPEFSGSVPEVDSSLWRWDGSSITATLPVPASVTPRQVRLLLLSQGLLEQVEALIAQQDKATQITWDYALEFKRNDPLLTSLAQNLGLSDEQIDGFFIAAAVL